LARASTSKPAHGIDPTPLREACRREVAQGLRACQVAVGFGEEVVYSESFGAARDETRFWVASATKPIVASAIWILIGEKRLEVERRVADYIPGFGSHGKTDITLEQVLLMTSGFPDAVMPREEGVDASRRAQRFAEWDLRHRPGQEYHYHPGSAHWVLADLIERASGQDFRDFVEERLTRPLGLPRVLGIERAQQQDIAQLWATDGETQGEQRHDHAAKIEVGEPGGGGAMRARDLARFYQGLLHDSAGLFDPAVLLDATTHIRTTLPDPWMKLPANRTLGVVVGPGFGSTWGSSQTAFGWNGIGGQIGFAEPATGVSFCFLQHGDDDATRPFVRGARMSKLALELGGA
jgi:CubicO group peptidase (beta-lactamase class C family)